MSKIFAGGTIPYGISKWYEPSDVALDVPTAESSLTALTTLNQKAKEMQAHQLQPGEVMFNCISPLPEKTQFQFEDGRWFQITGTAGHFYRARPIKAPTMTTSRSPFS